MTQRQRRHSRHEERRAHLTRFRAQVGPSTSTSSSWRTESRDHDRRPRPIRRSAPHSHAHSTRPLSRNVPLMPHSTLPRGASSATCVTTSTTRRRPDRRRIISRNRHAATYSQVRPAGNFGFGKRPATAGVIRDAIKISVRTTVYRRTCAPTAGLAEPGQSWPTGPSRERRCACCAVRPTEIHCGATCSCATTRQQVVSGRCGPVYETAAGIEDTRSADRHSQSDTRHTARGRTCRNYSRQEGNGRNGSAVRAGTAA